MVNKNISTTMYSPFIVSTTIYPNVIIKWEIA